MRYARRCPGRIGIWVGWQMVRAYMDAHPNQYSSVVADDEGLDFLQESGYKPLIEHSGNTACKIQDQHPVSLSCARSMV